MRRTLNSWFFQPVVSILHASLGAKRSSSALLLSSLTGRMQNCTWPLSWLPPPSPLPCHGAVPPLYTNCSFFLALIPLWHLLPVELQWSCFQKRGQLVIQIVKWMSLWTWTVQNTRTQNMKYAINLFWFEQSFSPADIFTTRVKKITPTCLA